MAKLKPNEKRVQLSFQRPEDIALYERLEKMAYERRYDLPTFLLLSLQDAFRADDTSAACHPASSESQSNQLLATDMDLDPTHRNYYDASEHRVLRAASHLQE